MRRRLITATSVAAGTLLATAVAAGPVIASPASGSKAALANSRPAWTAHTRALGHAGAGAAVHARVYLAPRHGANALAAAVAAVSTPGSPSYRHFLTSKQYYLRFGTSSATVAAVTKYLRASGLHVTAVGAHNRYLTVSGKVAAAEKAFGTSIEVYRHAGATVQAPARTLSVPRSLRSSVLSVAGLDTTAYLTKPSTTPKPAQAQPPGFRNARPCSRFYGQIEAKFEADYSTRLPKFQGNILPYAVCGYTGPQFRAAYEGGTALDGTGVSVGIIDAYASPTIFSDANHYGSVNGDGSYGPGQFTQSVAAQFTHKKLCGPTGWYGEETLDVEAVHAMAPGANIHYYGGASCEDTDLDDALAQVLADDSVQIVSNSYGDLGEGVSVDEVVEFEQLAEQAALEGISVLFSSGDDGDDLAATGLKEADFSATSPYVTAVGGTSTAIGANGALAWQTGWGTDKYALVNGAWAPLGFIYGAGGGDSTLFNRPSYQDGVVKGAARSVPDVAMDADPTTGMLIGETQTFADGTYYDQYRIGGTSLASPLFAGMTALKVQNAGGSLGFLNPSIYANLRLFTDVKGPAPDAGNVRVDYVNGVDPTAGLKYSVRTFDQDSSLPVTPGYDQVTGVGVPKVSWLTS